MIFLKKEIILRFSFRRSFENVGPAAQMLIEVSGQK